MAGRTEQLNVLMSAIRDVVRAKNCPDWVVRKLAEAVKRAKAAETQAAQTAPAYEIDCDARPFEIGEYAVSNVAGDKCLYSITEKQDPVNGVNLYTVRIEQGDEKNPTGYTVYNVPETLLQHVKF